MKIVCMITIGHYRQLKHPNKQDRPKTRSKLSNKGTTRDAVVGYLPLLQTPQIHLWTCASNLRLSLPQMNPQKINCQRVKSLLQPATKYHVPSIEPK